MTMGPIAWEDPGEPFPANLGLTWWRSITAPGDFFRSVAWSGPFGRPVLYWLLVWVIAGALALLWPAADVEAAYGILFGSGGEIDGRLLQLLNFFLTPFAALLTLGAGSACLHLFAMILAPEHRGIRATARALCYSGGPLVLASLPMPWFLSWLWSPAVWVLSVALLVLGQREAHHVTTGRAVAIVLFPAAIAGTLLVLLGLLVAFLLATLPEVPG